MRFFGFGCTCGTRCKSASESASPVLTRSGFHPLPLSRRRASEVISLPISRSRGSYVAGYCSMLLNFQMSNSRSFPASYHTARLTEESTLKECCQGRNTPRLLGFQTEFRAYPVRVRVGPTFLVGNNCWCLPCKLLRTYVYHDSNS